MYYFFMLMINGRMVRNEVDLLLEHACSLFDWEIRNYIDLLIYIWVQWTEYWRNVLNLVLINKKYNYEFL